METLELTHWKKEYNYDYLGAYSIPSDGSDLVLTIKETRKDKVTGSDGKKQDCFVLYFKEDAKPMILNRTNAKTIQKVYGTPFIEEWVGKQISLYATTVNAFGSQTDALRIRDSKPVPKEVDVSHAIYKLAEAQTLADVEKVYKALSKDERYNKEVIEFTKNRKTAFQ